VVFVLVVGDETMPAAAPYLIGAGLVLALFFTTPSLNPMEPLKNLINIVLGALGCFSDIISYVRLMAVGMAGLVLAQSFNTLAGQLGGSGLRARAVVGHLVNRAFRALAVAHGVRLEHAGVLQPLRHGVAGVRTGRSCAGARRKRRLNRFNIIHNKKEG
jgi:V/A-type H+-transporting ATPase subunit I